MWKYADVQIEDGRLKMEAGSWKEEKGSKLEAGSSKEEKGSKLEAGSWEL